MVSISDVHPGAGLKSGPGAGRTGQVDPIRLAVHASLALYLLPVIALVCLIGGAAVLAGKAAKLAARSGLGGARREGTGQARVALAARHEAGPRLVKDRGRSEATR